MESNNLGLVLLPCRGSSSLETLLAGSPRTLSLMFLRHRRSLFPNSEPQRRWNISGETYYQRYWEARLEHALYCLATRFVSDLVVSRTDPLWSGVLTIADTKGTSLMRTILTLEGKQSLAALVGLSPRMYHSCHEGPNGDHVYFVRGDECS